MTPVTTTHICVDDRGRAWIAGTQIKVIEVALDKIAYGWSAEKIHEEHSDYLTLAQVYAALAYYYDHKAEIDAEIERQEREYREGWERQGKDSPLHKKLRALGKIP